MAANGWLLTPISWSLIGFIWVYNLVWLVAIDAVKVALYLTTTRVNLINWRLPCRLISLAAGSASSAKQPVSDFDSQAPGIRADLVFLRHQACVLQRCPIVISSFVRPLGQFYLLAPNLLVGNETQDV